MYDDAEKSFKKIPTSILQKDDELKSIGKCIKFFKGKFEDAGVIGTIFLNAFEGKYKRGLIRIGEEVH